MAKESEGENSVGEIQTNNMNQPLAKRNEVPWQQQRTLREFTLPNTTGSQTSIGRPTVNANKFEIKPALIQMVQED